MVVGDCGLSGGPQRSADSNRNRHGSWNTARLVWILDSLCFKLSLSMCLIAAGAFGVSPLQQIYVVQKVTHSIAIGDCRLSGGSQRSADCNRTQAWMLEYSGTLVV